MLDLIYFVNFCAIDIQTVGTIMFNKLPFTAQELCFNQVIYIAAIIAMDNTQIP